MADLTLSGATSPSAANGDYAVAGTRNGQNYYKHVSQNIWISWLNFAGYQWWISDQNPPASPGSHTFFYRNNASVIGSYTNWNPYTGTVVVAAAVSAAAQVVVISE